MTDETSHELAPISERAYTTQCADGRRDFVSIVEALHYHALANGDGCWRDLLSHAAVEIESLQGQLADAEQRAEESALRSIEARNPGIDMDKVRASRNGSPGQEQE